MRSSYKGISSMKNPKVSDENELKLIKMDPVSEIIK